jgi:hypothetical protein
MGSRRTRERTPGDERGRLGEIYYGPEVGPGMSVASPAEVAAALERAPMPDDWPAMAPGVVPIFERRRPFPVDVGRPVRMLVPPGVTVTVAYDYGPALMRVTDQILAMWPIDERALVDRAMTNLRHRVRRALAGPRPVRAATERFDDIPVRAIVSGEGWASTLLLVPDLLGRIVGPAPALLTAPMRDLLLAFPEDIDLDRATWLTEGFESVDPNCLCLEGFAWDGRRLTVQALAREAATA